MPMERSIINYREIFYIGEPTLNLELWNNAVKGLPAKRHAPPLFIHFSSSYANTKYERLPYHVEAVAYYSVNGGHVTSRSDLNSYQLLLTKNGRAFVTYEKETYTLLPNSAMLIDCRKPHEYRVLEEDFWEYKHVHFQVSSPQLLLEDALGFTPTAGRAEEYFDKIMEYSKNEDCTAPYVYSNYISDILTALIIMQHKADAPANTAVEEIAKYIQDHFSESLHLEDISEKFHFSTYYLIRLFKRYYDTTPHNYLIKYRIGRAKEMLLKGHTVEDAALSCGFKSVSNFYTVYKKTVGVTPKASLSADSADPARPLG